MWASPNKKSHLAKLGFLDKKGGIVDIHEKRRGYHMAEKDIRELESVKTESVRDRTVNSKQASTSQLRAEVTAMKMQSIAQQRELRRFKKANALSQSTGSLPMLYH